MSGTDHKKLWEDYAKNKSVENRDKLIITFAPLVKYVAGRLVMYLGYNVEYDDLVGYGIFGLIDAIEKFDPNKDVKFETYASLRIRGAIIDQIRKMDWIPRTIRQKQKKLETAYQDIENEMGRIPTDEELMKRLGINEEELADWSGQIKSTNIISLNEYLEVGNEVPIEHNIIKRFQEPEEIIEQQELNEKLKNALDSLTEKERKVVLLYYYEDLTLKEISHVMEVSESRVSQLHTKSLHKLKAKLGSYMSIFHQ